MLRYSLYGMWKGFEEMRALGWTDRVPRFVAAEVSGSLQQAMRTGAEQPPMCERAAPSIAASIGAAQGTYQGIAALRASKGRAVFVSDDEILAWQACLGRSEGVYAEPSAAATLPAIARLRAEGTIKPDDRVVALLTAGGLKDPGPGERRLASAPDIPGTLDDAVRALRESYGFHADQ